MTNAHAFRFSPCVRNDKEKINAKNRALTIEKTKEGIVWETCPQPVATEIAGYCSLESLKNRGKKTKLKMSIIYELFTFLGKRS